MSPQALTGRPAVKGVRDDHKITTITVSSNSETHNVYSEIPVEILMFKI